MEIYINFVNLSLLNFKVISKDHKIHQNKIHLKKKNKIFLIIIINNENFLPNLI